MLQRWNAVAIAVIFFVPVLATGQSKLPRTPDNQPDLQGIWNNGTITPLERPRELEGKAFFTREEAAQYEKQVRERNNGDRRDANADADLAVGYNDFWWDRGTKVVATLRTSLIVDPPDGKIPALTPDGQKRADARIEARRLHPTDDPEDLSLADRCIARPGPPMVPAGYNNNHRIVQSRDYVAIFSEMMHDARIIPLDGRPHLAGGVRQWFGDSRGHWEGDTLVIDTTNFAAKSDFMGSHENLHLVERISRADADTLNYQFTVTDPTTWTAPWSGMIPLKLKNEMIFEYACHEGNDAIPDMLRGHRYEEREAAAKSRSKQQ